MIYDSWNFSMALLDTYAIPAYITANPVPFHEAPIRYLRTKGSLVRSPSYIFCQKNPLTD
jgi:hypothetical protein